MPRKTTTIVTCALSGCKAYAEVSDIQEAPEGWYMVVPATENPKTGFAYDRNGGTFEFHSLKCVEKWAKERRQFEQGTTPRSSQGDVPLTQQLLATAREYGEDFTPNDLIEVMGFTGDPHTVVSALNRMGREGELEIIQQGKPFGQQSPIYRAKQEA